VPESNRRRRVLLTTFGSYGDLYPYIAIGIELQKMGCEARIATSAGYRSKVEAEGLGFAPVRPDISLADREMLRYLFDQRRGTERVLRAIADVVRESYEDTLTAAAGVDAIVTHPITMGAVVAAEKLRLPWISSVLAPISFISAYDPPVPAPAPWLVKLRVFGPGFMHAVWNLGKRETLKWVRPVVELREEVGLGPGLNPIFEGAHAPGLVLALFSRIFAEPQPDWPPQALVTGFPFYDGETNVAADLEAFFRAGPPPLVFTLGSSAVGAAGAFYSDSLEAVQRLRTRAVFLTGSHPQGLPESLPPEVLAWPYAPHAQVFARAAAIVHQGGVGTTAQALRSGRPMLVVPFAHDQFDNAERVRRLGAGTALPRSKYKVGAAVEALRPLLQDRSYNEASSAVAARIASENGALTAAQAIRNYLDGI
jgi:UDP:flavonoid glycosyltransferase YjiC (YdhE family)